MKILILVFGICFLLCGCGKTKKSFTENFTVIVNDKEVKTEEEFIEEFKRMPGVKVRTKTNKEWVEEKGN